jgi:formylglycine-generating enzyme required for sulfatase activity
MSSDLVTEPSSGPSRGWVSRLLGGFGLGSGSPSGTWSRVPRERALQASSRSRGESPSDLKEFTCRLMTDERYVFILLEQAAGTIDERAAQAAWDKLGKMMALVPGGVVRVVRADATIEPIELPAFYLDRYAVTNRQYRRFVAAGCYEALEIWPREIWPGLMHFTDRTGTPGPRHWERGTFPAALADHPVTGVCWYEALSYARWVGKRLPAAAEWQKAAGWPEQLSDGACTRYPWGNLYSEDRANLWATGLWQTVPVNSFRTGATLNGIFQLSGNVWEWLEDSLEMIPRGPTESFRSFKPLRRIIGGAFDTYLPTEASNQFITGQPELDRRDNIGFRCAVSIDQLRSQCPETESPGDVEANQ